MRMGMDLERVVGQEEEEEEVAEAFKVPPVLQTIDYHGTAMIVD